jgi:hypothetical protein
VWCEPSSRRRCVHLQLRVHLLRGLHRGDVAPVSQLQRRARHAAQAAGEIRWLWQRCCYAPASFARGNCAAQIVADLSRACFSCQPRPPTPRQPSFARSESFRIRRRRCTPPSPMASDSHAGGGRAASPTHSRLSSSGPAGDGGFVMHGPDGGHHPNESIFRACDPDKRVQIEHLSPPHFTLTVTLELDAKGTKLTWAQSFPRSRGRRAGRGDRRARERGESGSVECGVERALSGPRSVCRLSATRLSSSLGTNRETPLLLGRCALRGDA